MHRTAEPSDTKTHTISGVACKETEAILLLWMHQNAPKQILEFIDAEMP